MREPPSVGQNVLYLEEVQQCSQKQEKKKEHQISSLNHLRLSFSPKKNKIHYRLRRNLIVTRISLFLSLSLARNIYDRRFPSCPTVCLLEADG